MSDDDDFLTAPVPDPDAEPTAAEKAHAKQFSELIDKTLASGRMPPAMSSDDRALLEVATIIRAAKSDVELAPQTQRSLIEDALRQAVGNPTTTLSSAAPVIPLRRKWLPWVITSVSTAVAAAAIVLLIVRKPAALKVPTAPTAAAARIPLEWRSRPADPLIGKIENECQGKAALECAREATVHTSSRIDHIFADRLEGYRERRLAGGKP